MCPCRYACRTSPSRGRAPMRVSVSFVRFAVPRPARACRCVAGVAPNTGRTAVDRAGTKPFARGCSLLHCHRQHIGNRDSMVGRLSVGAALLTAGCVQVGMVPVAQTDTAVTLRLSRATLLAPSPPLQEAEDYAQTYCGRRGLIPRLTRRDADADYSYLRYECSAKP